MTGSRLCSAATGEVLWGTASRMFRPWDGGYRIALPVTSGISDDVVPCGPIREMRIGSWRKDIYGRFMSFMEENGYAVDEDFFFFDYDWRRDNVDSARRLALELQRIANARANGRVNLICQSNAAYICRYLVKYGDVSLEDAERGRRNPPPRVQIEKVIFVGTANGGAIRILRELNRGRQYLRVIGRRWRPETFFTFPALYQDLPTYGSDLFLDAAGRPMPVDLFDQQSWRKYGWSIFAPPVQSRLRRADKAKFGTPMERDAFLSRALESARRLHEVLRRDNDAPLPGYYSIQSLDSPTPAHARLTEREGRWRTIFLNDASGDRHATAESQNWFSNRERAALAAPTSYLKERHFEMITTQEARKRILEIVTSR